MSIAVARRPLALVVDDDPMVRLLAEQALSTDGLEVVHASDGEQGLVLAAKAVPDIVLLDVQMPGRNGFQVCAALRQLPGFEYVPILMMTGLDDPESVGTAYDAGATDFVTKPVHWQLLAYRVRYLMRAAGAFRGLAASRAQLAQSQSQLAAAHRIAKLGAWRWITETNTISWSEGSDRVLGVDVGAARSASAYLELVHPDDRPAVKSWFRQALASRGVHEFEHRLIGSNGDLRFFHVQLEVELDEHAGTLLGAHGTARDITERCHAEQQIQRLAYFDSLTSLPNRQLFKQQAAAALADARATHCKVGILFIDLDRFKCVNDTLGHGAGDELLCIVAERLTASLRLHSSGPRGRDCVARLGGDEFVVLLPRLADARTAVDTARRLLGALQEPIMVGARELAASASIGVAVFPNDGDDLDTLLRHADTAMYHAKNSGRATVQAYMAGLAVGSVDRLVLEQELRRAIVEQQLVLHYQPQVDLTTHRVVGVEALVRWQHPHRGLLPPGEFISIAEESGQLPALGIWVLDAACAAVASWQRLGLAPVRVAVNMAAQNFEQPNFAQVVGEALARHGVPAGCMELELTESMLMRDAEATTNTLHALKSLGVRLVLDDFGTGYSSLSYLKRLPLDMLKIDRSFIGDLPDDRDDAAITSAIIGMAASMGLEVLAEGVETHAQMEFLSKHGCSLAQGYLLGRPMPETQLQALLSHPAEVMPTPPETMPALPDRA